MCVCCVRVRRERVMFAFVVSLSFCNLQSWLAGCVAAGAVSANPGSLLVHLACAVGFHLDWAHSLQYKCSGCMLMSSGSHGSVLGFHTTMRAAGVQLTEVLRALPTTVL